MAGNNNTLVCCNTGRRHGMIATGARNGISNHRSWLHIKIQEALMGFRKAVSVKSQ